MFNMFVKAGPLVGLMGQGKYTGKGGSYSPRKYGPSAPSRERGAYRAKPYGYMSPGRVPRIAADFAVAAGKLNPWVSFAEAVAFGLLSGWYNRQSGPVKWQGDLPAGWCVSPVFTHACTGGTSFQQGFHYYSVSSADSAICGTTPGSVPMQTCASLYDVPTARTLPINPALVGLGYRRIQVGEVAVGFPQYWWSSMQFGVTNSWNGVDVPTFAPDTVAAPLLSAVPPQSVASEVSYPEPEARPQWLKPYEVPAITIVIDPGGVKEGPPSHAVVPPAVGETEGKHVPKGNVVKDLYGELTEIGDVLSCALSNIKGGRGSYGKSIQSKARFVMDNWDKVDKAGFASCVAQSNASDYVVGKLSRGATRHYFKSGYAPNVPHGLGSGSFSQRMR